MNFEHDTKVAYIAHLHAAQHQSNVIPWFKLFDPERVKQLGVSLQILNQKSIVKSNVMMIL